MPPSVAAPEGDLQLQPLSPRPSEPSPARDALRSNLSAADTGTEPGLKKKKSWFGSMRDVFHKGALQAKGVVDSMRGEQTKNEEEA